MMPDAGDPGAEGPWTPQRLLEILPHRPPFLFVDRILECEPGVRAVGLKCVAANEPFFAGHFPGRPIMPGVLIIEALAQVGAVALLSLPEFRGKVALFGGVDDVRFRRPVVPGDVLRLEVEITRRMRGLGKGRGTATVDGQRACEGELTFAVGG
jgi:3-hydroxyacyl-[acyl-carrier-protein] dehydratase